MSEDRGDTPRRKDDDRVQETKSTKFHMPSQVSYADCVQVAKTKTSSTKERLASKEKTTKRKDNSLRCACVGRLPNPKVGSAKCLFRHRLADFTHVGQALRQTNFSENDGCRSGHGEWDRATFFPRIRHQSMSCNRFPQCNSTAMCYGEWGWTHVQRFFFSTNPCEGAPACELGSLYMPASMDMAIVTANGTGQSCMAFFPFFIKNKACL